LPKVRDEAIQKEFINHLSIAYGSLMEVETHLQIAFRLHYLDETQLQTALTTTAQIGRMLNGLMNSLNRKVRSTITEL